MEFLDTTGAPENIKNPRRKLDFSEPRLLQCAPSLHIFSIVTLSESAVVRVRFRVRFENGNASIFNKFSCEPH